MIEVAMGIDHKIDAVSTQCGNSRFDFVHHLRELVVYHQHPIFTDRDRDIAAQPEQHVEAVGYLFRNDLGALKVPAKAG